METRVLVKRKYAQFNHLLYSVRTDEITDPKPCTKQRSLKSQNQPFFLTYVKNNFIVQNRQFYHVRVGSLNIYHKTHKITSSTRLHIECYCVCIYIYLILAVVYQ